MLHTHVLSCGTVLPANLRHMVSDETVEAFQTTTEELDTSGDPSVPELRALPELFYVSDILYPRVNDNW